jgi:putative hydrolase of the HAD superfamily
MTDERKEPRPLESLPAHPRAVLIDAMGTLVTIEPPHARLREILERETGVHVSSSRAKEAFAAEIAYYLDHHLEGRDAESLALLRDRCAMVIEESLGDPRFTHKIVLGAMLDSITFHAYADAAPALRALREGGLRIVVCSNWDCSLPEVLADAGLLHLIDEVVSSAVAGAAKPDPRLFEAALAAARCDAGEAFHVGDSLEGDVAGALAAGIAAVLIDRTASESPTPLGTPLVRTLTELSAALAAGGRMLRDS